MLFSLYIGIVLHRRNKKVSSRLLNSNGSKTEKVSIMYTCVLIVFSLKNMTVNWY